MQNQAPPGVQGPQQLPRALQLSPQAAQSVCECGLHTPSQHKGSTTHFLSQAPQLAGSLLRSTQPLAPQQVLVSAQPEPPLQLQTPPTQSLPLLQGGLHVEATHTPCWHICPLGQGGLSHPPQCSGPLDRSKQPPLPLLLLGQHTWLPTQPGPPLHLQVALMHCSP